MCYYSAFTSAALNISQCVYSFCHSWAIGSFPGFCCAKRFNEHLSICCQRHTYKSSSRVCTSCVNESKMPSIVRHIPMVVCNQERHFPIKCIYCHMLSQEAFHYGNSKLWGEKGVLKSMNRVAEGGIAGPQSMSTFKSTKKHTSWMSRVVAEISTLTHRASMSQSLYISLSLCFGHCLLCQNSITFSHLFLSSLVFQCFTEEHLTCNSVRNRNLHQ